MYILAPLGEEVAIHAQSGLALDWIIPPAMMSGRKPSRKSRTIPSAIDEEHCAMLMNERMVVGRINRKSEIYNCSLIDQTWSSSVFP